MEVEIEAEPEKPSFDSLSLDLQHAILLLGGIRVMASASAVCRIWQSWCLDSRLWAAFCDELWPGLRIAAGANDCYNLCRRMLASVQQPKATEPSDVVLIIECSELFPSPLVHPLNLLQILHPRSDFGYDQCTYIVPAPHNVGIGARLKLIEEHHERIIVRLLRRRDGKICTLKRPGMWNYSCEREEEQLWMTHFILPSAIEFKNQGSMANSQRHDQQPPGEIPNAEQQAFVHGYVMDITVTNDDSHHLRLQFDRFEVEYDEFNWREHDILPEFPIGDTRPFACQELDSAFLGMLSWE